MRRVNGAIESHSYSGIVPNQKSNPTTTFIYLNLLIPSKSCVCVYIRQRDRSARASRGRERPREGRDGYLNTRDENDADGSKKKPNRRRGGVLRVGRAKSLSLVSRDSNWRGAQRGIAYRRIEGRAPTKADGGEHGIYNFQPIHPHTPSFIYLYIIITLIYSFFILRAGHA